MKNFEIETFSADLEKVELMEFTETSNLNETYNRFHQKLLNIINKIVPKETLSHKEMKLQTKPWIDKKYYIKLMKKANFKKGYKNTRYLLVN